MNTQQRSKWICFLVLALSVMFLSEAISESGNVDRGDRIAQTKKICRALQLELADEGFENVSVSAQKAKAITVSYENRRYRNSMTALGKVLQAASPHLTEIDRLTIVVRRMDVAMIAFDLASSDLEAFMADRITAEEFGERIRFMPVDEATRQMKQTPARLISNRSFRKLDVVIQPILNLQLGNREDPYKFQLELQPGFHTVLARGLTAQMSARVPILDEINFNKESVRPYHATLSYLTPISGQTFWLNHLGYFAGERYGISSQAAHFFLNGDFAVHAQVDYTGFLYYDDETWFYSPIKQWSYNLGCSAHFSKHGLHTVVEYGKYLRGDTGFRLAIGRFFRETRVDFFAVLSSGDRWVGIELGLPLFPNQRFRPRRIRLDVPRQYAFEYNYVSTDYGKTVRAGAELSEFRADLTANYIRNHLDDVRKCFPQKILEKKPVPPSKITQRNDSSTKRINSINDRQHD